MLAEQSLSTIKRSDVALGMRWNLLIFFITLYGKSNKVYLRPKNGAVPVGKHFRALIRANTVQLPGADLDPRAEVGFWWGCFGSNCFQLALGEAESDFGLRDYETDLSNLSCSGKSNTKNLNFFSSATCSTGEKIKGRTSHHLTIDDKHTNGWGKFTRPSLSLPLLSVSPHSFSISASFYNATRKEKKSLQGFAVTPGNSMCEFLLLQTPPSFEPYLPSKVLILISLEYHSRPNIVSETTAYTKFLS